MACVKIVLGVTEDIDRGIAELDYILDRLVVRRLFSEIAPVVGGLCTEKVLLDAERHAVGADHDDHEKSVWLTGAKMSVSVRFALGLFWMNLQP